MQRLVDVVEQCKQTATGASCEQCKLNNYECYMRLKTLYDEKEKGIVGDREPYKKA